MFVINQDQLDTLKSFEHQTYLTRVRDEIVEEFPELASDETLKPRLGEAFDYADGIGLEDIKVMTQFLYLEAFAPSFYKNQTIQAWLTKPGASVAQRVQDLIAVMRRKAETQGEAQ
jgi:hypothetical protein